MKIMGLDASTKITGYGIIQNNELIKHGIIDLHNDKNTIDNRIKKMINSIYDLIKEEKPDVIYIEEMWNKLNVQTTKSLSYVIGAVIGFSEIMNIDIHLILPSEWRKQIGLSQGKKKRDELKQEAINFVKQKYGLNVQDDEAEGIGICYCGYLLSEDTSALFE